MSGFQMPFENQTIISIFGKDAIRSKKNIWKLAHLVSNLLSIRDISSIRIPTVLTFRQALLLHFNATLKRFKLFVHHFETNLAKMFKYVGLPMMSSFGLADLMISPIFYWPKLKWMKMLITVWFKPREKKLGHCKLDLKLIAL